jgi:hypothetical protein
MALELDTEFCADAVDGRLRTVSKLRRLCLDLGRRLDPVP